MHLSFTNNASWPPLLSFLSALTRVNPSNKRVIEEVIQPCLHEQKDAALSPLPLILAHLILEKSCVSHNNCVQLWHNTPAIFSSACRGYWVIPSVALHLFSNQTWNLNWDNNQLCDFMFYIAYIAEKICMNKFAEGLWQSLSLFISRSPGLTNKQPEETRKTQIFYYNAAQRKRGQE